MFSSFSYSFNNVIPIPEELENTLVPVPDPETFKNRRLRKLHNVDNWYDWRKLHWGTKWNVNEPELEDGGYELTYHFDTAWSPPEGIHAFLIDKFPDVSISWFYREDGMQMAGYL